MLRRELVEVQETRRKIRNEGGGRKGAMTGGGMEGDTLVAVM
jgi:hypothetical protein